MDVSVRKRMAPVKIRRDKEGEEEKTKREGKKTPKNKICTDNFTHMLRTKRILSSRTVFPTRISLLIRRVESGQLDRAFQ